MGGKKVRTCALETQILVNFCYFPLSCVPVSVEHFLTPSHKTIEVNISAGRNHPVEHEAWMSGLSQSVGSHAQLEILSHRRKALFCNSSHPSSKSKAKTFLTRATEKTGSE